jgi:hypothetical protein
VLLSTYTRKVAQYKLANTHLNILLTLRSANHEPLCYYANVNDEQIWFETWDTDKAEDRCDLNTVNSTAKSLLQAVTVWLILLTKAFR